MDLERALTDLAEHLDVPEHGDWDITLTRQLTAPTKLRRRSRAYVVAAAAATIVVVAAAVLAVAPARHAVAGWLGIGAVEIRRTEPPPHVTRTTPRTTPVPVAPIDLAQARRQVQFEITTPASAPPPARVVVDRRVPGGLVVLTYDHFTLVEIATDPTQPPPLGKLIGDATAEAVTVHGRAGMWIRDAHVIGYLDRSGRLRSDTVRRSGPVLLWERNGVTFRVEGPHTLAEAMAIADTIV